MEQTDGAVAGLVGREQDCQPVGATVALWRMAESAASANRVVSEDGSYTPDDAVCASATTLAAVCEILGRLTPFLSGARPMPMPDVSDATMDDTDGDTRVPSHHVRIAFADRDEVIDVAID